MRAVPTLNGWLDHTEAARISLQPVQHSTQDRQQISLIRRRPTSLADPIRSTILTLQ